MRSNVEAQHNEVYDETCSETDHYQDEGNTFKRSLPAMSIAIAFHVIVLFIALFIVSFKAESTPTRFFIKQTYADHFMPPEEVPEDPEIVDPDKSKVEQEHSEPFQEDKADVIDPLNVEPIPTINDQVATPSPSPIPNPSNSVPFGMTPTSSPGSKGGKTGGLGLGNRTGPPGGSPHVPHHDQILAGLDWLADHQHRDGYWSTSHFMDASRRTPRGATSSGNVEHTVGEIGRGWEGEADVGVTGLALLAFLSDGHTHRSKPTQKGYNAHYVEVVRSAVLHLLKIQNSVTGCFGLHGNTEAASYSHAICTMAFAELYEMTGDKPLKNPTQRAVDYIVNAQNTGKGWRYGVKPGDNDSSMTAWMVLALKSAKSAGFDFDYQYVYESANNWFEKVTSDESGYLTVGYNQPGTPCARLRDAHDVYDNVPSMEACSLMVRLFTDHASTNRSVSKKLAGNILRAQPEWKLEKLDFYFWYYASLGLFHMGDDYHKQWEKMVTHSCLLKHQRGWHPQDLERFGSSITLVDDDKDAGRWKLDEHGSWDPIDAWGSAGGRVYSTAINILTLESTYRYQRKTK